MNDYKEKFEKMKIAGSLASKTLDMLTNEIKEGISTNKIDKLELNIDYENLQISSKWLGNVLKNFFGNNLLGPVSPYISKIRNDHLINIIIKYDEKTSRSKTKKILTKVVKSFQSISTFRSVKIIIDVDPQ